MERLIASKQVTYAGQFYPEGAEFLADDNHVEDLLRREIARKAGTPRIQYETKVVTPEAGQIAPGFPVNNVSLSHQEPSAVATAGDQVLQSTDVSEQGTIDHRGRGKRKRFGSRR